MGGSVSRQVTSTHYSRLPVYVVQSHAAPLSRKKRKEQKDLTRREARIHSMQADKTKLEAIKLYIFRKLDKNTIYTLCLPGVQRVEEVLSCGLCTS